MATGTNGEKGPARRDPALRELWSRDISVRAKDGVVVLTGTVHSYEEKMAAGQIAKAVYGGKGVANYIAVRPDVAARDLSDTAA